VDVMEIARFSVVGGVGADGVAARMADLTEWLGRQPGFVSRTLLAPGPDGRWTDLVRWRSHAHAAAALAASEGAPELAAAMALIDPTTVELTHHPVVATTSL
jgi:hypothetical protein